MAKSCASVFLLLIMFLVPFRSSAQGESEYDEISVYFSLPRIGGTDLSAVVRDEVLYLSVTDVFNFLKIKNTFSQGFVTISGFFVNEQDEYLVDRLNNRITYRQKVFDLKPGDLVRTETNLYLKSNYFGEIFDLQCIFNFRSLSVTLNTKVELPIIREIRQEQMRRNMSQLKGDIKADTTIKRSYPFFHFGMADWTVISSQQLNGPTDTRLALNLGTVLLGGETNVSLNYNNTEPFSERQQYYLWRYANNDHKALRQVSLGKITTNGISTLNSPLVGAKFTNTPTTYRGSFGTYTLSDVTEPGWLVELYVNNVLVDYKKADASGFFTFQVPLVYGSTGVKLQFYGPWGEERSKEQNINIPFNFLPVGNLEYSVTAGMVEDSLNSRYSRANFDFGVSRRFTVGGGVEYLSSLSKGKLMPYVSSSLRLGSNLLLSGEYTYGVRMMGVLNFRLPSDAQLEINYTKYDKNQKAINNNYLEERKVAISLPLRIPKFTVFSRLSIDQIVMPASNFTSAELLLSGAILGINTNFTTNAMFPNKAKADIYSNLSLSFRLPRQFIITPQAQYDYSQKQFVSVKCGVEKHIFKNGFLNLSYEQNYRSNVSNIEFGFRYDFSFAQLAFSARRSNKTTTFVESGGGSLMADAKTKYLGVNSRQSVGKGGLTIFPFLDINGNGKHEKNEPKAYGIQVHINGGRIEFNDKDTTTRVFDLEPYTNYLVTLDGLNFDNIAWQMRNKTFSVAIDPNKFKLIEIPISIVGEASGTVYLADRYGRNGQGRIIVNFYRPDRSFVARTITEADGFFSYLGLMPGNYIVGIDTTQMRKLNMSFTPVTTPITIKSGLDGDVVDGLEFTLRSNAPDTSKIRQESFVNNPTVEETVVDKTKPAEKKVYIAGEILYKVQLLALRKPIVIKNYFSSIMSAVPEIKIIEEKCKDGLYRYSAGEFRRKDDAVTFMRAIIKGGWKDCFISTYEGEKRSEITFTGGQTLYMVQLLAISKPVKIKDYFAKLLSNVQGLTINETLYKDGLYRYNSGAYRSKSEAGKLLEIMREIGCYDCFIVKYKAQQ